MCLQAKLGAVAERLVSNSELNRIASGDKGSAGLAAHHLGTDGPRVRHPIAHPAHLSHRPAKAETEA